MAREAKALTPAPSALQGRRICDTSFPLFPPRNNVNFYGRLYSQYSLRCLLQGNARKRKFIPYWPNKSLKQMKNRKKILGLFTCAQIREGFQTRHVDIPTLFCLCWWSCGSSAIFSLFTVSVSLFLLLGFVRSPAFVVSPPSLIFSQSSAWLPASSWQIVLLNKLCIGLVLNSRVILDCKLTSRCLWDNFQRAGAEIT